ncbi:hypothetical protein GGF42_009059, partial [Coemansia sp. RSA 2424]
AEQFQTYVDCLSREYIQRHSYLYGSKSATGALAARIEELDVDSRFSSATQREGMLVPSVRILVRDGQLVANTIFIE